MRKNHFISKLLIFTVISLTIPPFHASQAAVSNISWSGTNITGSSIDVSTELGDGGDSTINFTLGSALTNDGDQIIITLNGAVVTTGQTLSVSDLSLSDSGGSKTLEAAPGTNDNDAYEVTITNGSSGNSNPVITITLDSDSGTPPNFASGAATLTIDDGILESSATPGNYSLVVVTPLEVGIGLLYVGGANDVTVTASVDPYLAFVIRNSADNGDTNVCNLGTLSVSSVSTCAYRLGVSTNAANGFQVKITSDGGLRTAGGNEITPVVNASTVTVGNEEYGIAVTGATVGGNDGSNNFTEPVVEDGDFSADDTPIPTSPTDFISFDDTFIYTQGKTTTSTLVTHRAAISAGTAAGTYSQVVTYTVTGTF